jgi:hypothetical protein
MKRLVSAIAIAAAMGLMAGSSGGARADTIDYILGIPNSGLSGSPGPYGTVEVNLTSSTTATITFTADSGFGLIDGGSAGVNVNATSFSFSGLTGTPAGNASLTNGGSGNEDGFGSFNQTFDNKAGSASALTSLSFTLTDNSGTWASAANVLVNNAAGFLAAAHFNVLGSNCGGSPCTGFAANGVPGPTLGGGLPGLVAACVVLVGLARRRRQRIA